MLLLDEAFIELLFASCEIWYLQALREIAKAARLEGAAMLSEVSKVAVSLKSSLQGIAIDKGLKTMENVIDSEIPDIDGMITQVQDTERRQNSVAAVATSCLHASAPLLASRDSHTCLLVLDTIEVGWAMMFSSAIIVG